mmetsp:Transcript_44154/g.70617  ORF Transcript_44154/g.70617 Transcript_44154/m.70617 type:complete len:98 (-) Transcript_44154:48-341(-)
MFNFACAGGLFVLLCLDSNIDPDCLEVCLRKAEVCVVLFVAIPCGVWFVGVNAWKGRRQGVGRPFLLGLYPCAAHGGRTEWVFRVVGSLLSFVVMRV